MKQIFISHASKDKAIVQYFIDIILGNALSIEISKIFCTTTDGTKIKSGKNWRESIQEHLKNSKIIFLIITPNYKESEICQNEMGAAWVSSAKTIPIIIDPINYSSVGVIQKVNQIEKLTDETSLDRIKDIIKDELNISTKDMPSDRWTLKRMEFISKINNFIKDNPFQKPMTRDEYNKLINDNNIIKQLYANTLEEIEKLKNITTALEQLKDKNDVKRIKKEFAEEDTFEEFKKLLKIASNNLNNFSAIIIGYIYRDFTKKNIVIEPSSYWNSDINDAIANDYINDDLELSWEETDEMHETRISLQKLDAFMTKNEEVIFDEFTEKYNTNFSLSNKKFWKDVLNVKVAFE